MSVSLDDLANPENSLDVNLWNWRPTIGLISLTRFAQFWATRSVFRVL